MTRIIEHVRKEAEARRAMAASETDVQVKANLMVLAAEWDALADRHEQLLRMQHVWPSKGRA